MAGDAPAIARVRVDSWRSTYRGMIPDAYLDGMKVEASTALWDRVLTAGPNATCVFVAEHGADIVGFSAGNRLQPPKHGFDAELAAIIVEQPFQWDGMDLTEAGYGWRDLDALAAACAVAASEIGI